MPVYVRSVNIPGTSGTVAISQVAGWSLRNTSSISTATVRVRKGSITGVIIATIQLNASESIQMDYTVPRDCTDQGSNVCYFEYVSGAVEGSIQGW